ncbi:AAA family ATPase [Lysobacter sp.]|uniref:AAA family ATPase n=1 Tax=Lysobacter sp. TaxID=72226 RepID=UPI002D573662|nr:AAA family ATPase [Lysobacter sp.]HZX78099.1 AAA family ATPase [Lysobacter sp.]
MRIKRFIAPDMRTALRMVRDEQGPDAVILSNRPVEDGIEIVSATDYDESLAQQALRAALPSLPPMPAPVASPLRVAAEASAAVVAMPAREPAPAMAVSPMTAALSNERPQAPAAREEAKSSRMGSLAALLTKPSKAKPAWTAPAAESAPTADDDRAAPAERAEIEREEPAVVALSDKARSKIAESPIRGRAVFAIGDGTPVITPPRAPKGETLVAASLPAPDTSRFDAMMAALIPQQEKFKAAASAQVALAETAASQDADAHEATRDSVTDPTRVAPTATVDIGDAAPSLSADVAAVEGQQSMPATDTAPEYRSLADLWADDASLPSPTGRGIQGEGRDQADVADVAAAGAPASYIDLLTQHSVAPHPTPSATGRGAQVAVTSAVSTANAQTHLHAVADNRDPAFIAMRDELATMRQLIERELSQMSVERLRGTPARAAAFDALMSYGCDENLAQAIAGRIDARLDPSQIREPMLEELARSLSVARQEPIDDGGVIALVGPTGAGKTTTAAKLAARFAQRHRARDVALVTTDTERPGATEQLHILGRRLGVTVCEANGPEALNDALDQLADYPLVIVDTAGHGLRDRALLGQILWLRAAKRVRSLLVLPANSNAHDLGEVVRRYRPASPEGVVLTKLDETGRLGSALSVLVQHGLSLAYTTDGQQIPHDLAAADARRVAMTLEKVRRAADNPLGSLDSRPLTLPTEDRHAIAS